MRSGILLIDKPAGITSAGVVGRVKRMLGAERVGHAGTLDPDATGLLVILVNGATRVASYAADGTKRYSGRIRLGLTTSTDDISGDTLSESPVIPPFDEIVEASKALIGTIQQVPPRVSAIKVGGKRAHKMTREGESFELAPRQVHVSLFALGRVADNTVTYQVECSPGTYVRSLARDLGAALGCGATVETIRRESSGPLAVNDAMALEEVSWERLEDWSRLIPDIPHLVLPRDIANAISTGHQQSLKMLCSNRDVAGLAPQTIFSYRAEGDRETLGLLRILPSGEVRVEINIGRYSAQK